MSGSGATEDIATRAARLGIHAGYHAIGGGWREAPQATLARFTALLSQTPGADELPALPADDAPAWLPPEIVAGGRLWGVAVQLYGLRSHDGWGIGDFGALASLAEAAARAGADAVLVNPLHALFRPWPDQCSPYAPSSRLFLNPLYISVPDTEEFSACPEARALLESEAFSSRLAAARQASLVDYAAVSACKHEALRLCFAHFRRHHLRHGTGRGRAFESFCREGGLALSRFCTFEALLDHLGPDHPGGWQAWPPAWRDPASAEVKAFAGTHADEIAYSAYLQWLARDQVEAAARRAREAGMAIGVIADVAIGADGGGADAWADQSLVAADAELGAPPDPFAPGGQTWGAPPWRPTELVARGLEPFRALIDASMSWAGGLRLDHVIGFERQFWVPRGAPGHEGTYVSFPRDALLATICAASRAHRCLVIGEDLGTVPDGFRDCVRARHMLTTSVMRFERRDGDLVPPGDYPRMTAACAGTHDLVPIAGFAAGTDIIARAAAAPGSEDEVAAHAARSGEVAALDEALAREGLRPASPERTGECVHRFLARTPSALVLAQLEDILDIDVQPNLPGTVSGHPNWRRTCPLAAGSAALAEALQRTGAVFAQEGRGRD